MKKVFNGNNRFNKLFIRMFLTIITGTLIVEGAIKISTLPKDQTSWGHSGHSECKNIPDLPDGTIKMAVKIIDGDTFLIENGYAVRILGINADEKDYSCYDAAKNKLEEFILNREVKLEKGEKNLDQYCRYLRYVFIDDKNVSLELVKNGLAIAYFFPENIKYQKEISIGEKQAKENKIGCKWLDVKPIERK